MTEFQELVKDAPEFALMGRGELAIYAYAMYAAGAKLEAENAKLREVMEDLEECDQIHRTMLRQVTELKAKAKAENAKLRDLATGLYRCWLGEGCDGCPMQDSDGWCIRDLQLRELRIEVDG